MIMLERNKIIDTEVFHQEIGKLIFAFSQIVETIKYDSKELLVYYVLIRKIISNATSANILIYEGYINESKIILRSAVETVILITYLTQFPEKINDYLDEAQIIKIKNNFIVFNSTKSQENKRCFNMIQESAKIKILKSIGIEDFVITEYNYEKFNKYFTNFKPQFMKYENMYKELDKAGFKLKDVFEYSLRDIVYGFYNDSSQIAHGCFLDWHHKIKLSQKEAEYLFHFFIKVTLFLKVLLKGTINFDTETSKQYLSGMKQAHEKLEKLIYGKVLKH